MLQSGDVSLQAHSHYRHKNSDLKIYITHQNLDVLSYHHFIRLAAILRLTRTPRNVDPSEIKANSVALFIHSVISLHCSCLTLRHFSCIRFNVRCFGPSCRLSLSSFFSRSPLLDLLAVCCPLPHPALKGAVTPLVSDMTTN